MARVKFRVRWYLPLALCLLLLPFIIERTVGYYTDGQKLQAPEEEAEDSLRSVLWEDPRLVEGGVSTPGTHDYEPRVGPFGEILVFTRGLPGSNADLWVARKEKGQWVDPIPFTAVNSDASELGAAFSPDGSLLYFYSDRDGGHGGYDIWISEQTPDGWSLPRNLGPGVNSPWNEMNPAPAPGDGALYFVSDRRPGEESPPAWKSTVRSNLRLADWDLYVAVRPGPVQETVVDQPGDDTAARELPKEENSTEAPEELEEPVAEAQPGEPRDAQGDSPVPRDEEPAAPAVLFSDARPVTELNTPGYADGTPAFSPLGDFIYFSSNRPGGEGTNNFDLYRARVAETGFVELESLGPQVNTAANELDPGIALRGYELYFSRDDAGGQTDILFTLSREVRHVTESDGPYLSLTGIIDWLARLIRNTPAWLLSLLLALLVCGLLLLLFRRYILSPTVLAICFLIALLLHVFTGFWMNRNKVQRLLLEVIQEEEYEAFEVALESIPEEVISLEIREASAETKQDEAPALSAQLAARETPRPQPTLERPVMEAPAIERPETEVLPFSETVLQREAIQAESSESLPEDLAFPEERREALTPEIIKRQLERPEEVAQEERELVSDLRVREVFQARVELPEIELPEREPVEAPQLKEMERTDTQAPVLQASKLETENIEAPDVAPNEKQASQSEVELAARQLTPEERAKAEDSRIEVAREVSRSTPQENKPVERAETAVELARADPSEAQPETTQRRELSPVEQVDSPTVEKQAPAVENAPERAVVNSEQPSVEAKTLQRPEPVAESARENLAIKSAQPVSRPAESAEASIERPEVELNASPAAPPVEGAESEQRPAVAAVGKAVAAVDSPQANPEAPGAAREVAVESDAPDVSRKQLEAPAETNPETGTPALEVAREVSRSTPQENKPVERAETAVELARADPSEAQPETTQRRELSPVEQVDSPTVEKQAPAVENAPQRAVVNSEQPSVEAKTLQRPEPVAESARENLAIKSAQPVSRPAESAEASIERPEVELNASPAAPPVEGAESEQRLAVATVGKAVAAVDSPQANPEAPGAASKVAAESDAPDVSRKQLEVPAETNPETGTPALKVARQATRAASEISRTVAKEVVELEVQKAKPVSGAADSSNEAKLPDVGRAEAPRTVEKEVVAKEAPQRSESAEAEPTIAKRASVQAEAVDESVSKKVLALKQAGPVSRSRKAAEPVKAASAVVDVSRGESASPATPRGEAPRRLQVASAGKAVAASSDAPSIQQPTVSKAETGAGTAPALARRTTEAPQPEASGESQSRALKVASERLARTKVTEAVVGKTAEQGKVALQRSAAGAATGLEKTVRSAAVSRATQAVVSVARTVEKEVVAKEAPQRSESAGAEPTIAKRASVQAEAVDESVSKKVLALKQAGPVSRSRKAAEPVKAASAVVEVSRGKSASPATPTGDGPRRLQVASAGKAVAASGDAPSIQQPPVSKAETGAGTAPAIARRTTEAPQPEASGESQSRALKVASARLARTKVTEAVVGKTAEQGKVALQRSAAGAATGLEKTVRSAAVSRATQAVVSAASKGEAVPEVAAGAKTDAASAPVVEERAVAKAGGAAIAKAPPKPAKLDGGSRLTARKAKTTKPKLSSVGRLSGISRLRRPRSTFQGGQGKSSAKQAVARPRRVGAISSEGTELESISRVSKSTGDSAYLPKIYQLRGAERREEALMKGGGTSRTEAAVAAGLRWLVQHQSPDGKWTLDHYTDHLISPNPRDLQGLEWNGKRGKKYSKGGGYNYKGSSSGTVGTAMALLAFFGHGESHLKEGPYRRAIDKGLKWLVKAQKKDGDLRGGGNLYMHGIAAFALTEAYAFTRDPALKGPAQLAIDFTVKAQVPSKGGWRYNPYPQSQDVDTSVFGWMMMALKSGKLGGLKVDKACLSRAAMYLENARMGGKKFGEYAYQPGSSRTTHAMTAQGFFCQKMLSDTLDLKKGRKAGEIRKFDDASMKYFMANLPVAKDMNGVNFYYWYYATHALFQQGGQPWRIWNERLTDVLLENQVGREHGTAYGSWDPRGKRAAQAGRLYSTVLSILCLEVYYRYAPLSDD